MELYKFGKVVSIGKTYIIFESNYQGVIIYVARPKQFEAKGYIKLFIYNYKSEYTENIYGFKTFKERILFENLISVSGVGPKTALNVLNDGPNPPISMISNSDAVGLSGYPSLGIKTAKQIIFELKDKYITEKDNVVVPHAIKSSLKTLGFSKKQIEYAITNIKPSNSIENMLEKAIVLISNANFI